MIFTENRAGSSEEWSGSFTTTDLLCWSFQVIRGMQHLVTKKVLHGDLATRNILLCHDNVVKICDFGLARSMYNKEIYYKEGKVIQPDQNQHYFIHQFTLFLLTEFRSSTSI